MSDIKFPRKMNVKAVKTKYGEILKIGIHKDAFKENEVSDEWLNVDILRSKKDNSPYLVINEFKPQNAPEDVLISEDEIPY